MIRELERVTVEKDGEQMSVILGYALARAKSEGWVVVNKHSDETPDRGVNFFTNEMTGNPNGICSIPFTWNIHTREPDPLPLSLLRIWAVWYVSNFPRVQRRLRRLSKLADSSRGKCSGEL